MRDERDLLEVLKTELEFMNGGGYARLAQRTWRPAFIFEDSPACMNRDYEVNPASCGDCVLMQLVPPEFRSGRFPCRHIPLNAAGETLNSLYRYGDEHEIAEAVKKWLQATIAELQEQRQSSVGNNGEKPSRRGESKAVRGTALHETQSAKCANPACPVEFDWRKGGKFFRFRAHSPTSTSDGQAQDAQSTGVHGVKHYWLCERCSHIFTLIFDEKHGVILELLHIEFLGADLSKKSTAA